MISAGIARDYVAEYDGFNTRSALEKMIDNKIEIASKAGKRSISICGTFELCGKQTYLHTADIPWVIKHYREFGFEVENFSGDSRTGRGYIKLHW